MKVEIMEAPMLVSLDYVKPFYIYSFAFGHTCAILLTQRGKNKEENLIASMSTQFKEAELKYMDIENKL